MFTDTVQEGLPSFCVRHELYMFSESHQSHISIAQMFNFLTVVFCKSFPRVFLKLRGLGLFKAAWPRGFRVVSDIGIVGLELWKFCRRACRLGKFWQGRPSEKQTPET